MAQVSHRTVCTCWKPPARSPSCSPSSVPPGYSPSPTACTQVHHPAPCRANCAVVSLCAPLTAGPHSHFLISVSRTPCPLCINAWTAPPHNPMSSPLPHCLPCNGSPTRPCSPPHNTVLDSALFPSPHGTHSPTSFLPHPTSPRYTPSTCGGGSSTARVELQLPSAILFADYTICTSLSPPTWVPMAFLSGAQFCCFASPPQQANDAFRLVARRNTQDAQCA